MSVRPWPSIARSSVCRSPVMSGSVLTRMPWMREDDWILRSHHRLPREQLQPYLFPDTPRGETPAPIEWSSLFGNENPIEVEVGFGKGLFLLTTALDAPEVNFFGIEV